MGKCYTNHRKHRASQAFLLHIQLKSAFSRSNCGDEKEQNYSTSIWFHKQIKNERKDIFLFFIKLYMKEKNWIISFFDDHEPEEINTTLVALCPTQVSIARVTESHATQIKPGSTDIPAHTSRASAFHMDEKRICQFPKWPIREISSVAMEAMELDWTSLEAQRPGSGYDS